MEGIHFPSNKDDLKNWENSEKIALNVLYAWKKNVYPAYVSKHNSNREREVILLMISNVEEHHYLAVKKLSALLRGITFIHHGNFYYLAKHHLLFIQTFNV